MTDPDPLRNNYFNCTFHLGLVTPAPADILLSSASPANLHLTFSEKAETAGTQICCKIKALVTAPQFGNWHTVGFCLKEYKYKSRILQGKMWQFN